MVKARIARANQILGLLSEFSIILRRGIRSIIKYMPVMLADAENGLPGTLRKLLERLNGHLEELGRQMEELALQIKLWHKENETSQN